MQEKDQIENQNDDFTNIQQLIMNTQNGQIIREMK